MQIYLKEVEVRCVRRIHRETMEEELVHVSNRNRLSAEKQLRLLNANDPMYHYVEVVRPSSIV